MNRQTTGTLKYNASSIGRGTNSDGEIV